MLQGYARPPTLWSRFLRDASGVADVVLPYGDEQMAGVLGPRSVVLAGFGPRRGGEAARAQAARLLRAAVAALQASGTGVGGSNGGAHCSSAGGAGTGGGGGAGGGGAAPLPAITLVEPSFGAFSGSCVLLLTPRDGDDAAALAECLRAVQLPPGSSAPAASAATGPASAAAGAGPSGNPGPVALLPGDQRLAVFEARRMLCLQLHADELWVPNQGGHQVHGAAASELVAAGAEDEAAAAEGAGYGAGGEDAALGEAAGGDGGGGASFSAAASGRGLHDRLADACNALAGVLGSYRLPRRPGGSPSKHTHQHQQHPQGLQVLCRFTRVPAPGEQCLTLLAAAADEAADLLAAMSHLQAATAPQLRRQHGVTLTAQLLFSAEEVAAAAEAAAARAAAGLTGVAAGGLGNAGVLEAVEQQHQQAPRHRLPSLAFTPQQPLPAGQAGPPPAVQQAAAGAAGVPPPAGAGQPALPPGMHAVQQAAVPQSQDNEDEDEGHDKKGKKKKKRKNKKKRHKNKVVPL